MSWLHDADAAASVSDAMVAMRTLPRDRVHGLECPLGFDDADVVLARVDDVTITACDLALAEARDRREGLPPRDRRAMLRALVDEAMLAHEAHARRMDEDPVVQRRANEALASAVVHADAARALAGQLPDAAALRAYYDAHRDEFTSPERAHLREIVVATESEARAVLRDAEQSPFETLVERTRSADGTRDQGDLGLVARGGNDRVPAAIADAGFALSEPGSFAPDPVRVERQIPVGRHGRTRREVSWHVVQFLGSVPSATLSFEEALPTIWHRLAYGRLQSARANAREGLLQTARQGNAVTVDLRALGRVRVRRAR